uniref:Dehydrin-1 n=1 Tax=Macrotyloma uniflorum TaxID=271171 RepID=M4Q8Z7_MACUN|nr:dehydrin-1 [Macrotyloma uniflorum]
MSQYLNQFGAQPGMTDVYGNPVNQVDLYGNPLSGGGLTGEAGRRHFGTTGGATDHRHRHGQQHRGVDLTTGYGTHTSGVGGCGTNPEYGNTNSGSGYGTGTGYGGSGTIEYVREDHHGDKKGVMDKIKEKILGTEQSRTNTDGGGYGSTRYGASGGGIRNTGQEYVSEEHRVDHGEKKGIMDKTKEKLPGTGGCTGH